MGIPTKTFEELLVWQKAHKLVLSIYSSTMRFPKEELYGLVSQIRRSSISVAANIAEGYRKRTRVDKQRFLTIAHGSLEETRYYLILSRDLGYCDISKMMSLLEEISKLLTLYYRKIATV
ncbi:MAG TPA: four helix bundle protein [Anaerohalosphaeraceae bacterium]|nr:four helix bundle protein [Anaerohalosphaeraceae bacterium]HPP56457.1 four helix bundle protein [Anaerohalosphaeraceae bacterium]